MTICGNDLMLRHPCFSKKAHHRYGRIHLPVAPVCNIHCRYCIRRFDCANESRPGVTSRVLSPDQALDRVRAVVGRDERITVAGIAGPGDPLANPETEEALGMLQQEFPGLYTCLSTNGLLLSDRIGMLKERGVKSLTVTINAVRAETAESIYSRVHYHGKTYHGPEAAEILIHHQWEGLRKAVDAGFVVKVNTVCIPGINDEEILKIAEAAGGIGVSLMNITALIPQGEFRKIRRPQLSELSRHRLFCGVYLPQMSHCRQCRADAAGLLGEEKDIEMETLLARIGDEYQDGVW